MTQPRNENEPEQQPSPPAWPTPAEPASTDETAANLPPAWPTPAATAPADPVPAWPTPADPVPAWPTPGGSTPADPTPVWQSPADSAPAWQSPAGSASGDPTPAWQSPADSAPAWQSPAATPAWQSPADSPPAWQSPGEHAASQPPAAQQPVYQTPADPFHATTNTPASAQLPGSESGSPYTAPTYYPTGQAPVPAAPAQPISATPYPYAGYPGAPVEAPKKKHKGLIITAVVLGVLLVLCLVGAAGAFLLLNNNEGKGPATAKDAAQGFLTAIYKDGNATAAEKLVCKEARDAKEIGDKVQEIKEQGAKLKSPSYTWDAIKITNETEAQADTTVVVKLTTSDEKVSEQTLKLVLVKRDGWFVCDVKVQSK